MGPKFKLRRGISKNSKKFLVPSSIFKNREISVLEAISKYFKEELNLNYHQIAILLNRDERTIWTCYNRSIKKQKARYKHEKTKYKIPVSIFHDRSISVLEAISEFMKDSLKLSYHEIAIILNRDDRTIWTCYNRTKRKRRK